jgi:hypothetical protein
MEQRLFNKITRPDGLQCKQIPLKLLELYDDYALSYSQMCYQSRHSLMGREYVEDARRTGRRSDFGIQLRIQSGLEELPHASVRCSVEAMSTPALTVFYILTEVLGLRFRHWR